ncbi:MAG: hypothetical protein JW874_16320 [Spirochaetales bacterium]|nr:hypothetical protein [Spirochaetales bacterium]
MLSTLPGSRLRLFGFETGTAAAAGPADMGFCCTKDDFATLQNWCDSLAVRKKQNTYWKNIAEMAAGRSGIPADWLRQIWIELDSREFGGNGSGEPAMFLELAGTAYTPETLEKTVLPAVTGRQPGPGMVRNITRLFDLLPSGAVIAHIGYFPARSTKHFRLTIALPLDCDIIKFCTALFGKAVPIETAGIWADLSSMYDFAVLHIDISSSIAEKLGFEFRFTHDEQNLALQWRWQKMLDYMQKKGLCATETAEQLLSFSGTSRLLSPVDFSPVWYRRYLNYLKGVFSFSGQVKFKAYCVFQRLDA